MVVVKPLVSRTLKGKRRSSPDPYRGAIAEVDFVTFQKSKNLPSSQLRAKCFSCKQVAAKKSSNSSHSSEGLVGLGYDHVLPCSVKALVQTISFEISMAEQEAFSQVMHAVAPPTSPAAVTHQETFLHGSLCIPVCKPRTSTVTDSSLGVRSAIQLCLLCSPDLGVKKLSSHESKSCKWHQVSLLW